MGRKSEGGGRGGGEGEIKGGGKGGWEGGREGARRGMWYRQDLVGLTRRLKDG